MNVHQLTLRTLEKSTAIYRNVMYHRNMILESMRHIAFRNMRHLGKAIAIYTKPEDVEIHSAQSEAWIQRVQDQMLKDQGLESSELNRLLAQRATFTPVKLYVALLHAEIEYLDEWKGEYPLSSSTELHHFLSSYSSFVELSRNFRHGILHPNNQSIPSEQAWVLSGFENELPRVQNTVDSILNGLQATLREEIKKILIRLPELQKLHCYMQFLAWLVNDDALLLDDDAYSKLTEEVNRVAEEYTRVYKEAGSLELSPDQLQVNRSIYQCMTNLHPPDAFHEPVEESPLQPKMNSRLLKRVVQFMETPPCINSTTDRYLNQFANNLPTYTFIIDAVGVLLNETTERVPLAEATDIVGDSNNRILAAMENLAPYERQSIAGQAKVCSALLQGLVRPYENVCRTNPGLANQHIESVVSDGDLKNSIQRVSQRRFPCC